MTEKRMQRAELGERFRLCHMDGKENQSMDIREKIEMWKPQLLEDLGLAQQL